MTTSWKFSCSRRVSIMERSASARLALLSAGRVGGGEWRVGMAEVGRQVGAAAALCAPPQERPVPVLQRCPTNQPTAGLAQGGSAPLLTRVQVGGGLVQRQNAAVEAEGLGQGQANDEAGEHLRGQRVGRGRGEGRDARCVRRHAALAAAGSAEARCPPPPTPPSQPSPGAQPQRARLARLLSRRAAAAHVELRAARVHDHSIVVRALAHALLVRLDLRRLSGQVGGRWEVVCVEEESGRRG